jgi:hypothetical protein
MLPILLVLRPGVVVAFGVGSILLRRLAMALAGREARRAAGLSSAVFALSRSSKICTRLEETGVPVESADMGVVCAVARFLAGVDGDCIGLASGRREPDWDPGMVEPGRAGGGESAEARPSGLRTGMAEWLETLRSDCVGMSLRCGEGVVSDNGLKL